MVIDKEELEYLRNKYPIGSRVKLTRMIDVQAPPKGTYGTVRGVDDIGSIMVSWDNGSSLSVVYAEDECVPVRICPFCKKEYNDYPATSRYNREIEICPECGNREALEMVGMPKEEIDKIMAKIETIKAETGHN